MKPEDFPELANWAGGNPHIRVHSKGGNDEIYGSDMISTLQGGSGDDYIKGGDESDWIMGHAGDDILLGKDGNDVIEGDEGDDKIDGGDGKNKLYGGYGDDILFGNRKSEKIKIINGGPGDDTVYISAEGIWGPGKILSDTALPTLNLISFDADSNGLFIIDSSGTDSLSFAEFDLGIAIDLDLFETQQIYTANNDTLTLNGNFENFIGTPFDDEIHVDPLDVPRTVDGGSENGNTLYVETRGETPVDDGTTITYTGYEPITYTNIAVVIFEHTLSAVENPILLKGFYLAQNYPNPFNPSTLIQYQLPRDSKVNIIIYDLMGNTVRTLINEYQSLGQHNVLWNGKDDLDQLVSGGIYFCKLQSGAFIQNKKMVLMK